MIKQRSLQKYGALAGAAAGQAPKQTNCTRRRHLGTQVSSLFLAPKTRGARVTPVQDPWASEHVLNRTQLDTSADHKLQNGAFSPAADTQITGTALATAHGPCPRPRHVHLSLSSQKVRIEKTNFMSAVVPEGEDKRKGGPASGPFDKTELLRVVHCDRFSCSTDVTVRSALETRVRPGDNFEWTCETVESVSLFSSRSEGFADVLCLFIATSVHVVCERCFYGCGSLRSVIFGASSMVERICAEAFRESSVESLSIPDSVVELGERCFRECKSLRSVIFGASSRVERICAEAFCDTSIESLSIPYGAVYLIGDKFTIFEQTEKLKALPSFEMTGNA